MTFLNATLLFGALATAIPLVLHLIARREPQTIVFPAVRFLTTRYESNRSRLRVRRWWLLALRMLAIGALAITLARPTILGSLSTTWLSIAILGGLALVLLVLAGVAHSSGHARTLTLTLLASGLATLMATMVWGGVTVSQAPRIVADASAPVAAAIVIDNGPSSQWLSGDENHLARHRASAIELLSRFAPTSRIGIVDRSTEPASLAIDVASAIAKLESLESSQVPATIASRIDSAIRLVQSSDLDQRHVFVFSDLAMSTWNEPNDVLKAALQSTERPVALTIIDQTPLSGWNRSLGWPILADASPPAGAPIPLTITAELHATSPLQPESTPAIENSPPLEETSVTAELVLYEQERGLPLIRDSTIVYPKSRIVDRTQAKLTTGQAAELLLTLPPLERGTHHAIVRFVGNDRLALDDQRFFTVTIPEATPLLVVASADPESRILAEAINAPFTWDDLSAEFTIDRISYDDFPAVQLDSYRGVILLDPPHRLLNDVGLVSHISRGGGLLVCLGPSATPPNGSPTTVSSSGTSDSNSGSLLGSLVRPWRAAGSGSFLVPSAITHPALAPFAEMTGGVPWNQFPVYQYWQIAPLVNDAILVRFAGTDYPAIVERRVSNPNAQGNSDAIGRTVIVTTPLPGLAPIVRGWNDLYSSDSWPAFLLTRQLVDYIAKRDSLPVTTSVGQPRVVPLSAISNLTPTAEPVSDADRQRIQLFAPSRNAVIPLSVPDGGDSIVISEVDRAGVYWLRGDRRQGGFSANLPVAATSIQRVETTALDEWFGKDSYPLVHNLDEIDLTEGGAARSVSLESPAMLFAVIVFLLEQLLANRFYGNSKQPAEGRASSSLDRPSGRPRAIAR